MNDNSDLRAQVMKNTSDIGSLQADIAVVRTNTEWIKEQFGDMKRAFNSAIANIEKRDETVAEKLEQKEKQTWEKLSDVGVIKLIVFGATGIILSGFMMAIAILILKKLGLSI